MTDRLLTYCRFLSELDLAAIPEVVLRQARRVLFDTVGVIISGSQSKEVAKMATVLAVEPVLESFSEPVMPQKVASCLGRTEVCHPLHAAMINGMAGANQEYEEGHARAMGHPAIQIVPALLAVAEAENRSGGELLRGLVGGYEAACRISMACRLRPGLHPNGSWGAIGAALGVGILKGRSAEELAEIAELAACGVTVPWVENAFSGWNGACLFAGSANQAGVSANLHFEAGLRAAPGSFEKTFSAFVADRFDWGQIVPPAGNEFAVLGNYFKPYPTCRFTHPALDAVQQIMAANPVEQLGCEAGDESCLVDRIRAIHVHSFRAAAHLPAEPTRNSHAVRFSVPHLIAILLLHKRIDLESLNDAVLHDPALQALADKVQLHVEPAYEALRPAQSPARVEIWLAGEEREGAGEQDHGQVLSHEVRNPRGGPDQPIGDPELAAKFLQLTTPVLGASGAEQCLDALQRLDQETTVRPLIRRLRAVGV